MRFLGILNRMGLALSPIEFGRYIHKEPEIIKDPMIGKQIKFIREEPFDPKYGFFADWFAWDKGKTLCFLDCEDFGNGISDFLFGLLSDVVKRNDENILSLHAGCHTELKLVLRTKWQICLTISLDTFYCIHYILIILS